MTDEERLEIETTLRELRARNTVLETVQTQLLLRLASLFDQPQDFVRLVMTHAENNLRRGRQQATGQDKAIAEDAVRVLDDYSLRLIAALTARDNPQ